MDTTCPWVSKAGSVDGCQIAVLLLLLLLLLWLLLRWLLSRVITCIIQWFENIMLSPAPAGLGFSRAQQGPSRHSMLRTLHSPNPKSRFFCSDACGLNEWSRAVSKALLQFQCLLEDKDHTAIIHGKCRWWSSDGALLNLNGYSRDRSRSNSLIIQGPKSQVAPVPPSSVFPQFFCHVAARPHQSSLSSGQIEIPKIRGSAVPAQWP